MNLTRIQLDAPYLLFLGDVQGHGFAKTALGIAHWVPERCIGQMRLPGCDVDCGLAELDVSAAREAGVRTAVIGVAPIGGQIPPAWGPALTALARAGINIAAGLHSRLTDIAPLVQAARQAGVKLIDVRVPPPGLPIANCQPRPGRRLLTVGTDCAVGKKYTALALHRELLRRGTKASFRATGQTGIMIVGEGIPIDAVPADFIAGAAETLSPANHPDHWDVIEGQGSLLHPAYAGVTLGLLHGAQPDAIVLCHDAARTHIQGFGPNYPTAPPRVVIDTVLAAARLTSPDCRCVGISVNTVSLDDAARERLLGELEQDTGLPCIDPLVTGVGPIADALRN
jgi:uncharacterized NAD-dependent epimerase/dehydratase family protein